MNSLGQGHFKVSITRKTVLKDDEFGDPNARIILADSKLIFINKHKSPSKKSKQFYEIEYPAYDLKSGKKLQVKLKIKDPLFEYIDTYNSNTQTCDNIILLRINLFVMQSLDYAKTKLLILKKTATNTFTEINQIDNFQQYDGSCYQVSSSMILFYKNYDYHPLDDSIPTLTSLYNIDLGKFEKIQTEKFDGIYVTNLVGQLIAAKSNVIFKAYPTQNIVTVSNASLNVLDTIQVPIEKNYTYLYSKIDSLKKIFVSKKEFIYESKKIDANIERIESVYLIDSNNLAIIVKPEKVNNFNKRRFILYNISSKTFTDDFQIHYDYSGTQKTTIEPNFTYNNSAILFAEEVNSTVYIAPNRYLEKGKVKGSENYFFYVMKYKHAEEKMLEKFEFTINDFNTFTSDSNVLLFNLKGDTTNLKTILSKKSLILVKNWKNCSPCFKKAFEIIKTNYKTYPKYYVCEFTGELLSLVSDEPKIKKSIKVENIYYFIKNTNSENTNSISNAPTPLIIKSDNGKINYIPLDLIDKN